MKNMEKPILIFLMSFLSPFTAPPYPKSMLTPETSS